jgi:hypothetical protein
MTPAAEPPTQACVMAARLRVLSALCALVAAVIVVWQTNPGGPAGSGSVELRSTAAPLSDVATTIKWPVIETVNPRPFDPCEDIPLDVIQRIGLAFTPPARDILRCHYDATTRWLSSLRLANLRGHAAARCTQLDINGHRAQY